MKRSRKLLIVCFFMSSLIGHVGAEELSESIVAPLVEDDLRQAKTDIRMYERNIKVLDELLVRFQKTQLQKNPRDLNSESSWKKAKAFIDSHDAVGLSQEKYRDVLGLLAQSLEGATVVKDAFWNRSFESFFEREVTLESTYLKVARSAASDVMSRYGDSIKAVGGPLALITSNGFINPRVAVDMDVEMNDDEIKVKFSELKQLFSRGHESVYASVQDGYFEAASNAKSAAETAIKGLSDKEKENLENKKKQLSNIVIEFKKLESQDASRRESTDIRLVYAVYGMIGVLLFLFLGLKVFTDDVAKSLIVNRSLVEVVGMAFMLITIIILGTGEKLSKEILGTLLGTIAGYVFARGTEDARAGRNNVDSSDIKKT
jgi:hypothetical protein